MVARAKPLPPRFSHDAPLPIDSLVRPSPGHFRCEHRPRQTASWSQARRGHQAGAEKRAQRSRRQSGHGSTAAPAPADKPAKAPAPPAAPQPLNLQVQKATLDNGLRVVMNVDHTSPTVAVDVIYDVGARNEERGRSGFAHLFEHMMFQGSANVAQGRALQARLGARRHAQRDDVERSHELLRDAARERAAARALARGRPHEVARRHAENFENQRKVVKEEYRMRVANVAYVPAQIRLEELVFQGYWPYEHAAIGSMQDLDAAQLEWVRAFHDSYYAPNNAVLSIAGDFEPDEAMRSCTATSTPARSREVIAYEPPASPSRPSARSATSKTRTPRRRASSTAGRSRRTASADHYALELAGDPRRRRELAPPPDARARQGARARGVGLDRRPPRPRPVRDRREARDGARVADTQKAIDAIIDALAKDGPTDAEMTKVRNRTEAAFLFGLQSNLQRATQARRVELFWGDARLLNAEPANYLAVTKDDIKRVVAKYLVPARSTLVEVAAHRHGRHAARARGGGRPRRRNRDTDDKRRRRTRARRARPSLGKEKEGGKHKPKHKKEAP